MRLKVGSLGFLNFPPSLYLYNGSALNSLEGRIERHKRKDKKKFWHIDYLIDIASLEDIIVAEAKERLECKVNLGIFERIKGEFIKDFGSSDCNCVSHLIRVKGEDPLDDIFEVYRSYNLRPFKLKIL
ncbi:hypothetical protein HRbin06_01115 [archaeon HR06]|nr:hypothetical protein HRbin06_01115 [archaeon HR06]